MEFKHTGFEGLIEIYPRIFKDDRGHFFELYHQSDFQSHGIYLDRQQSNQSYSEKGVVRGLHFQLPPFAQSKLVRVISGKALDVVVDLRHGSTTFGKHYTCVLDASKNNMLYVPKGFAHGFAALENSIFQYDCDQMYHPESERGLNWQDPYLNIDWKITNPLLSEKDSKFPNFRELIDTIQF